MGVLVKSGARILPWTYLALVGVGLFALAYDQGQLLGSFLGDLAYHKNWLHEFFHDARHAAGFPCH